MSYSKLKKVIIGLLLVPTLVAKLGGMYKINYRGYALAILSMCFGIFHDSLILTQKTTSAN